MSSLVRKHIIKIDPYEAGKPIEETKRQLGLRDITKLASNENPLGASPRAVSAIRKNLSRLNRYPDSAGFYLKKKLAKFWGLAPQNFVLGNGSDELIDIIIKTFVEDDQNIITADPTFLEYKIISGVNNRTVINVPLKYFTYDLEGISKKINKKTKLIFIANPNNPTGTYVTKYEIEDFLRKLPEDIVVVMDEAYDTFIDIDDFPRSLSYINSKNLITLKTFSKAYGLAGLRVGYAVARSGFTKYMETVRQPFNVNSLAQAAALAALDDRKFLSRTRRVVLEGKEYLYRALADGGIVFVPTVANFILIDVGKDGTGVFNQMLKYGVIVRDMRQYGLKNFIRVTIGRKKENEKFIRVLKKVL